MNVGEIELDRAMAEAGLEKYDVLLTCLGYEQRAITVASKVSQLEFDIKVAICFEETTLHNYVKNKQWYEENSTKLFSPDPGEIAGLVVDILSDCTRVTKDSIKMLVDISCFSSDRIAAVIEGIQKFMYKEETSVNVDFFYTLAKFSPAPMEFIPNRKIGPVSPFFSGWKSSGTSDQTAIFGLGYEVDKAQGVYEYLEPKSSWLFVPKSQERQYLNTVLEINKNLIEGSTQEHVIYYSVTSPLDTYSRLSALTRSISQTSAPIIIPFGPKIFVLISLLVSIQQFEIPVWRVSGRDSVVPPDRLSAGVSVGVRVKFDYSVLSD